MFPVSFTLILYWPLFKPIQSSLFFVFSCASVTSCCYRTLLWDFLGSVQDVVFLKTP